MQREKIDYPFIDGLRLLAFLLVFFRHFNFFTVPVLHEYGWIGVEFFFLISGFLITRLLVTEFNTTGVIDKRKFFMRRILRIWPLYFFYLFLVLFLSIIYPGYPVSVPRLAGNLLFADNWISALKNYNPNFASFHLWSISLEEQFYFVLPFFVVWLQKLSRKQVSLLFTLILILFICWRCLAVWNGWLHPYIYTLPASGDCFLAGVIIGSGFYDQYLKKNHSSVYLLSGILFLLVNYLIFPQRAVIGLNQIPLYFFIALGFSCFLLAGLYSGRNWLISALGHPVIRYLGRISYGLYVYHIVALIITFQLFKGGLAAGTTPWSLPVALLITFVFAALSYELLEKKFLRRKKKYTVIQNSGT